MKGVHVLGDSTLSAPAMPKSASMANQHGKIARRGDRRAAERPQPRAGDDHNTCYSFVSPKEAIHVSSVHQWDAEPEHARRGEGLGRRVGRAQRSRRYFAWSWARTIWADSLA